MKYITLSAATIFSLGLISQADARESFYNLRNTEPSISVNLSALGDLEQQAAPQQQYNGKSVSGYIDVPGSHTTPIASSQPPKPIHKPLQVAKVKAPKPVGTAAAEMPPMMTETKEMKVVSETKPTPMPVLETENKVPAAPLVPAAKPSITLPAMSEADIKGPTPTMTAPASIEKKRLVPSESVIAVKDAKTEQPALSDMPTPAIIPEAAKAVPPMPTKQAAALSKTDKVVSLPASTSSAMPDLIAPPKPMASEPLPKLVEAKSVTAAKKPAGNSENIATPNFVVNDDDSETHAPAKSPVPTPIAKPQVKKTDITNAKLVASASDKSLEIPNKPSLPVEEAKMDDSLTVQPQEIKPVKPAMAAAPTPPAPKSIMSNTAPTTGDNPLEKPTIKTLPPLASLYDKSATSSDAGPQVGMPSKETVLVQPQAGTSSVPPINGAGLSMVYGEAEVELPLSEKPKLDDVISQLNANKDLHVTVLAYASGTPDQASQAKRTALARALAVRTYLLDHNISAERMEIKPLGNKAGSGVPDRVDIVIDKTSKS